MQATENGAPRTRKTILSIDGGGIRGAIPAVVLHEIEKRAKAPICELFDVIAGTSTGGILALGLARPRDAGGAGGPRYSAADLLAMYEKEGGAIFPGQFLAGVRQVFGPKYPSRGRRRVLEKRFETTLLSEALTEVIVTAYDLEGRKPVFFRRADARGENQDRVTRDFRMSDVAMATSAAPTFFKPVQLPDPANEGKPMALVDGGVFANNPGMCGFVDRTTVQGQPDDVLMISLGTGRLTKRIPYWRARQWGLLGWGRHIISVVFDGETESVEYELEQVLSDFHRLQVWLKPEQDPMDKPANVGSLVDLAKKLIEEEDERGEFDKIVKKLLDRRTGSPQPPSPLPPAPTTP